MNLHYALEELEQLIDDVQVQNIKLQCIAWILGILTLFVVVVVILGAFKLHDVRNDDLRDLNQARYATRLTFAESDLRGCRHDEEQDRILANLLNAVLARPIQLDIHGEALKSTLNLRREFKKVADRFSKGRRCYEIISLKLISKNDKAKLLATKPRDLSKAGK